MQLALAEIAEILGCRPPRAAGLAAGYSIDSRTIRPGEVFFAIRGENRDGHDYTLAALGAGAVAAVVAEEAWARFAAPFQDRLLAVADPTAALQRLAQAVRRRWGRKLAAVTGSSGKTSTKEMIARVLGARFVTLKSEGNLNNHLGVPLSLLRLTEAHEAAVVEMGMNHGGEIARLAAMAEPEVGVFTNVGAAHLGFFRSVEQIAEAKYELVRALPAGGTVVINADDRRVARFGDGFSGAVVRYGIDGEATGSARRDELRLAIRQVRMLGEEGSEFVAVARDEAGSEQNARVRLPLLARHNISNAAAALATGLVFGVPLETGARALAALEAAPGRGRIFHCGGATIVDDSYNSNPLALENMVNLLAGMPGTRRILVVGEMRELGAASADVHRRLGEMVAQRRIDVLFAVEGDARHLAEGARAAGFTGTAQFFETAEACGQVLATFLRPGDVLLAKGSRGVRLERALAGVVGPESLVDH